MKVKLFFVLFSIVFLFGCEGDFSITYRMQALEIDNASNNSLEPEVTSEATITANKYAIHCEIFPMELSRQGRYADRENGAPRMVPSLDSIFISCDTAYNDSTPPGTHLGDYFDLYMGNYSTLQHLKSQESLVFSNYHHYNFHEEFVPRDCDLLMKVAPQNTITTKFYVKFLLSDGTFYNDFTNTITITP